MFTGLESPVHILLLLLIIILLFGAKRLPEMGRSLGRGIQEFKEGLNTKEGPKEAEQKSVPEEMAQDSGQSSQGVKEGLSDKEELRETVKEKPARAMGNKEQVNKKRTQTVEEKKDTSAEGSDVIETLVSRSPQGRGLMWLWRKL